MINTDRLYKSLFFLVLQIHLFSCNSPGCDSSNEYKPFTFAVIADVQYADMDNRRVGTPREVYHRDVLNALRGFVDSANKIKPQFVIQLGDLIEGHRHDDRSARKEELVKKDLVAVLDIFDDLDTELYHVIGNHCLPAGRESLLKMVGREKFYYDFSFDKTPGWRFLVLDGNEADEGLMGKEQVEWLRVKLSDAVRKNQRVICFSHYPLIGEAGEKQGLDILDEFKPAVAAWMAGHRHTGNYTLRNGVHHITFKGMVENPEENAFALIHLYPESIVIEGFGAEKSRNLTLNYIETEQ